MIRYSETKYGFYFGAAEIIRVTTDEEKGWVVFDIKTPKETLQVYVTKTGKIRIHDSKREEWLPPRKLK